MSNFKIKNNKKGFTLVELLAVLVIIISITGIAIVSFMKVSEKQKENEYEKVKDQVFSAAQQYFSSNEYLFDGIEESGYGIITVEELVKSDYLNKATNPLTGKPLNVCDQIKVTKDSKGKYKLSYFVSEEYSSSVCSSNSLMMKTHENAPEITVSFNANIGNDMWFNKKELNDQEIILGNETNGLFVKLETKAPDVKYCYSTSGVNVCDGELKNLELNSGWNSGEKSGYYDKENFNKQEANKKICYVASNESGSATACIEAGVDINIPEIVMNMYNDEALVEAHNSWTNTDVYWNYKITDNLELSTAVRHWNKAGKTVAVSNTDGCNWNGTSYGEENCVGGNGGNLVGSDKLLATGTQKIQNQGARKARIVACDVAGNCAHNEKNVYIDKTAPEIVMNMYNDEALVEAHNGWTNTDVYWNYKITDNLELSTAVRHWNINGLITSRAEDDECQWNGSSYGTGECQGGHGGNLVGSDKLLATGTQTIQNEGHRKARIVACDVAGNCATIAKNVYIDKSAPSVVVTTDVDSDNDAWYKKDSVGYSATAQDVYAGLKSMVSYWNQYGLTTTEANKNEMSWNGSGYSGGGSETITVTKGTTAAKTVSNNFTAQGHRKIRYVACDTAGNCASDVKVVKIDRTAPNVSVTLIDKNSTDWYNTDAYYTGKAQDAYSGLKSMVSYWNQYGLTTALADSTEKSWSESGYSGGSSDDIDITYGSTAEVSNTNKFTAEGHRKIRYKACDTAGNCASDVKVVKIDKTPPIFVRYSGGKSNCGPNSWGYSIEFKDALSSSIAYMPEYYSSWDCGGSETGGFYWASSSEKKSNSSTSNMILSTFAGCSNNPSPAAKFYLIDAAGNKSDTLTVYANKSSTAYSPAASSCDWSKWWNVQ